MQAASLYVSLFPETGRGLASSRPIFRHEVMLELPLSCLMTTATALASDIGSLLSQQQQHSPERTATRSAWVVSPLEVLCLHLLRERIRGPLSRFKLYIDVIPAGYSTPWFWTAEDMRRLSETHPDLVRAAERQRTVAIPQQFQNCWEKVISRRPDLFPASLASLQDYAWAHATLMTRSVYFPADPKGGDVWALAPLGDLFNHKPQCRAVCSFSAARQAYLFCAGEDYPEIGTELFIDYGPYSNRKLLLDYGFAARGDNPHDDLFIPMQIPRALRTAAAAAARSSAGSAATALANFKEHLLQKQICDKEVLLPLHDPSAYILGWKIARSGISSGGTTFQGGDEESATARMVQFLAMVSACERTEGGLLAAKPSAEDVVAARQQVDAALRKLRGRFLAAAAVKNGTEATVVDQERRVLLTGQVAILDVIPLQTATTA